jgi:hypothetical protein
LIVKTEPEKRRISRMFPYPTLQHMANCKAIDRVTAAQAKTVVRGLKEGADNLMKARANVYIE